VTQPAALTADELPEEDQFGRVKYLELCREMGISPASQIVKYLESESMHVVHYGAVAVRRGLLAALHCRQLRKKRTAARAYLQPA
jgi:hypothetical protein